MDNVDDVTDNDSDIIHLDTVRPTDTLDGIFAAEREIQRELNKTLKSRYGSLSPESQVLFRDIFVSTPTPGGAFDSVRTPSSSTPSIPNPALCFTLTPSGKSTEFNAQRSLDIILHFYVTSVTQQYNHYDPLHAHTHPISIVAWESSVDA